MVDQLKTDGNLNRKRGNCQNGKYGPKYQWKEMKDHGLFRGTLTVVTSIVNQNMMGLAKDTRARRLWNRISRSSDNN